MANIINQANIDTKGDGNQSPDLSAAKDGAAAADGDNAEGEGEEKLASDHEEGEEEGEEEGDDDSLSQIEETKEILLMKKKTPKPMGGVKGVVEAMKKQISQEKLDSARTSGGGSIKKEEVKGD